MKLDAIRRDVDKLTRERRHRGNPRDRLKVPAPVDLETWARASRLYHERRAVAEADLSARRQRGERLTVTDYTRANAEAWAPVAALAGW